MDLSEDLELVALEIDGVGLQRLDRGARGDAAVQLEPRAAAEALEPLFLREQWGSAAYDGGPLIAGLALALVGCVLITTSPAVSRLVAASS